MAAWTELLKPITIKSMTLRNRIVMSPMYTQFAGPGGEVTERMIQYYVERARGGVGLIILENTNIDWQVGRAGPNPTCIDDDRFIPGLHTLVEAVHRHGARMASQLQHAGRQTNPHNTVGAQPPVAPSPVACKWGKAEPRELSGEEIERILGQYVAAARRTRLAGFDAVEIHGAHGYLPYQFTSPYTNRRTDQWGGSLDNRMRFPLEIVRRIRQAVGADFPIMYRLSAEDGIPGGLTLEHTLYLVQRLEEAGVDSFDISAGIYETPLLTSPLTGMPPGRLLSLAAAVKEVVHVPVSAVGRLGSHLEIAEQAIGAGKVDLVNIGRALLADPALPEKILTDRREDIRPCIACDECLGHIFKAWPVTCVVNPLLGHEWQTRIEPARAARHVVVIGAGPAGMEAACLAAERGHRVTLLERDDRLGGQLLLAGKPWFKEAIWPLLDYYAVRLRKSTVDVQLGTTATKEVVAALVPDAVVVATGALAAAPGIPGCGLRNCLTAVDVLQQDAQGVGDRVAIVGGGEVGIETALFLARQGRQVTVLEMTGSVAADVNDYYSVYLMELAAEHRVAILTSHRVQEITSSGVTVQDLGTGETRKLEADSVVTATGFSAETALARELEGIADAVYSIGSCARVGRIYDAVSDAIRVASRL